MAQDQQQETGVKDVFNGDADGIFARHLYRLSFPSDDKIQLVTGVKRDVRLLEKLTGCNGCAIQVFDISLDANRTPLDQLLTRGNRVLWYDHHFAGTIPDSPYLRTCIDTAGDTCTSLIVAGSRTTKPEAGWAIGAAFGDNLHDKALERARSLHFSSRQIDTLKRLGELFNYNGYGNDLDDLHFHPRKLALAIRDYRDPLIFAEDSDILERLDDAYRGDMARALQAEQIPLKGKNRAFILENAAWSRRISGVFSNLKAREQPDGAHAIISSNVDGSLRISVRAPLNDRRDADTLCKQFPGGGGRAAAAGINCLDPAELGRFLESFNNLYR